MTSRRWIVLGFACAVASLAAQSFPERMRLARDADHDLVCKAACRLRTTPERVAEVSRRQPNLYLTPEGGAVYLCEIPAGALLGWQTPDSGPAVLRGSTTTSTTAPSKGTAAAAVGGDTSQFVQTAQYSAAQTFKLHSRPGAKRVIYLDFDGHITPAGTLWGGRIVSPAYDIDGNAASFSGAERGAIQNIWRQVAEDFAPFDIDVTTEEPGANSLGYSGPLDNVWGVRVVIGGSSSDWYKGGAGGVAFVGTFQNATELPCFVFSKNLYGFNSIAYAASHEVGHTLGLSHDGTTAGAEYYGGHASWAPIMGAGYGSSVVQWSKGEYALANNTEDDVAVIAQEAPYATADIAKTKADALTLARGDTAGGTIQRDTDQAWYRIPMTAGAVNILGEVASGSPIPNLKLQLTLFDEADNIVAQTATNAAMGPRLQTTVTEGVYYLVVEGIGAGTATASYNDYGSLGRFRISGTWPNNPSPLASTAGSTPLSGKAPLTVNFSSAASLDFGTGTIVGWLWDFGDGTPTSNLPNPAHTYATPGTYTATLTVTDDLGAQSSTTLIVTASAQSLLNRQMLIGGGVAQWVSTSRSAGQAKATFRFLDSAGRPMPGVTVVATLAGLETATLTGVTDRTGNVVFSSRIIPATTKGTYTFTVRGATLPGYAYLPSANKLSSLILKR